MGVDELHPLQAKAQHMDAEALARDFKGRVSFIGGIDRQDQSHPPPNGFLGKAFFTDGQALLLACPATNHCTSPGSMV